METVRRLAPQDSIARHEESALAGKLAGLAIVSLVPALFWTSVLALIGPFINITFSMQTLLFVGLIIAIFLSVVFGSLALSQSRRELE